MDISSVWSQFTTVDLRMCPGFCACVCTCVCACVIFGWLNYAFRKEKPIYFMQTPFNAAFL